MILVKIIIHSSLDWSIIQTMWMYSTVPTTCSVTKPYLAMLIRISSGLILCLSFPCLGWSPRPRNRPGGSILKLPHFLLVTVHHTITILILNCFILLLQLEFLLLCPIFFVPQISDKKKIQSALQFKLILSTALCQAILQL